MRGVGDEGKTTGDNLCCLEIIENEGVGDETAFHNHVTVKDEGRWGEGEREEERTFTVM